VAELTGLTEAEILSAAAMIGDSGEWMTCWTVGLNQSTHGTWSTNAICNLHLATGAICRPGSGPMSLTGQPNAMGGREMGYLGPGLPGQRSVVAAGDRAFVEERWGVAPGTIRSDVGPGTVEMFERVASGDIKACWIICTNPVATMANRRTVITALEAAELVVTQDAYGDTATNRYADVILPAAPWAESDHVMVNTERNLTLLQQSVDPVGQARPDWMLICQVAAELGFGEHFAYDSSEQIFDELRQFGNPATGWDLRGATYQRLRETPLQWPVPPADLPGGRRPPPDPLSQRRRESGVVHRRARRAATARLSHPVAAGGVSPPAAPGRRRAARRRVSDGVEYRPPATSMAHDDQDREGRGPERPRRRPVRGDAPGRRAGEAHRRRAAGRGGVASGPRGPARRGDRAGPSRHLLRAV
jgi:anaerobic selenocysteine-containing dehydrogenase